jgi:hypothetical protein
MVSEIPHTGSGISLTGSGISLTGSEILLPLSGISMTRIHMINAPALLFSVERTQRGSNICTMRLHVFSVFP